MFYLKLSSVSIICSMSLCFPACVFNVLWVLQPPTVLRPSERSSETLAVEIAVTKLLLRSYYEIVRKNVEDLIPKAIMHFLVFPHHLFFGFFLIKYLTGKFIASDTMLSNPNGMLCGIQKSYVPMCQICSAI